jgi:hypothetical protein
MQRSDNQYPAEATPQFFGMAFSAIELRRKKRNIDHGSE